MSDQRFKSLLVSESHSLEDFAFFISVVEELPIDLLWQIANNTPRLHPILRNVVTKTLQGKVARKNVDDSLDEIVRRMRQSFS